MAKAFREDQLVPKVMPANLEAEKAVLGGAIHSVSLWEKLREAAVETDFFTEGNRRIFASMLELVEKGDPVNTVTVGQRLHMTQRLESVGGFSYLADLRSQEEALFASSLRIVLDCARRRDLMRVLQANLDRASVGLDTVEELAADTTARLGDVTGRGQRQGDGGSDPTDIIRNFPGGLNAFLDPTLRATGIMTGLSRIDDMMGGFRSGELVVIGARSGHGKSAMALSMIEYMCSKKHKFAALFSFEMSAESILTRLICSMGYVSNFRFRKGYLDKTERDRLLKATNDVSNLRFRIYDKSVATVLDIEARLRRLVRDEGLHIAFVDYLQLIGSHGKSENRNLEIGQMTRRLKLLAMELGIPIVVLSQLSRGVEKRGGNALPQLSDLRDSGSVEADSDAVLFIIREDLYKQPHEEKKGATKILIAKQRNGPVGVVEVKFLSSFVKFVNAPDKVEEKAKTAAEPPPFADDEDLFK